MNDRHWYSDKPELNMAWVDSSIDEISCDIPTIPLDVLFEGKMLECEETRRTVMASMLATIATFSACDCSRTAQWDEIVRSCLSCSSNFAGGDVTPCLKEIKTVKFWNFDFKKVLIFRSYFFEFLKGFKDLFIFIRNLFRHLARLEY